MRALVAALAVLVVLGAPAAATILPATQAILAYGDLPDSSGAGKKHPEEARYVLPVTESVDRKTRACVEYANTVGRAEGTLKVTVRLLRDGRRIARASFRGRVRRAEHLSVFYGCTARAAFEPELAAGDELEFTLEYKGLPRLMAGDVIVVTAGVTG